MNRTQKKKSRLYTLYTMVYKGTACTFMTVNNLHKVRR